MKKFFYFLAVMPFFISFPINAQLRRAQPKEELYSFDRFCQPVSIKLIGYFGPGPEGLYVSPGPSTTTELITTHIGGKEYGISFLFTNNGFFDMYEILSALKFGFSPIGAINLATPYLNKKGPLHIHPFYVNDILFTDLTDSTTKSVKDMMEPELVDKMNFKNWQIPLHYWKDSLMMFLTSQSDQINRIALLNLQTGETVIKDIRNKDIRNVNFNLTFLKGLAPGLFLEQYYNDINDQKTLRTDLVNLFKSPTPEIIASKYCKLIFIDEYYNYSSHPMSYLYTSPNNSNICFGYITDQGFVDIDTISRNESNTTFFDLFRVKGDGDECKINYWRYRDHQILLEDQYGSYFIYNLSKNALLERKYGSLQIKNDQLSEMDWEYLAQFHKDKKSVLYDVISRFCMIKKLRDAQHINQDMISSDIKAYDAHIYNLATVFAIVANCDDKITSEEIACLSSFSFPKDSILNAYFQLLLPQCKDSVRLRSQVEQEMRRSDWVREIESRSKHSRDHIGIYSILREKPTLEFPWLSFYSKLYLYDAIKYFAREVAKADGTISPKEEAALKHIDELLK